MRSDQLAARKFRIDLIILLAEVLIPVLSVLLSVSDDVVDIQLHDTYLVLDKVTLILLMVTPLVFFTFLIKGAMNRFKSVGANFGLLTGIFLAGYMNFVILNDQMIWPWGTMSIFAIGFAALGVRTFKLLNREASS